MFEKRCLYRTLLQDFKTSFLLSRFILLVFYRFKSIVSFGWHYCVNERRKKFLRSALILTNKRLVVLDIYQRCIIATIQLIITFNYDKSSVISFIMIPCEYAFKSGFKAHTFSMILFLQVNFNPDVS